MTLCLFLRLYLRVAEMRMSPAVAFLALLLTHANHALHVQATACCT